MTDFCNKMQNHKLLYKVIKNQLRLILLIEASLFFTLLKQLFLKTVFNNKNLRFNQKQNYKKVYVDSKITHSIFSFIVKVILQVKRHFSM